MKRREIVKSFVGALIGILIYESLFDLADPFQSYWINNFTEIVVIAICVFGGILLVDVFINKFSLFESGENA